MAMAGAPTFLLPLNGGAEAVRVDLGPAFSLDRLLQVLRAAGAPVAVWLSAAHHLLAAGREAECEAVLSEAVERGEPQAPQDVFPHVQALCSLAEFTAQKAVAASGAGGRRERQELLIRSSDLCHKAARLNLDEQLPELVLAHVALVKGDTAAARKGLEKAMRLKCNGRTSIAAQLALASLLFNQRSYAEALRLYKAALRACPTAPPEVRLGVAACSLKLGSTGKAELAYRRVLELAPDCTPALLGLAVLKLHVSNDDQGAAEGSRLLSQAFEQDPENPFVLLLLAHFCLRQGFADKARQLAETVLAHGGRTAMQAEGLTILGRACHALGQLNDAYKAYQQANQVDPKLPLPRLGLAQLSVLNPQQGAGNAASLLESVLVDAPHWIDALEVLGRVYPHSGQKGTKVVPQFKEAAAQRPGSAELWELLGDLLSSLEPAGALKAYDKAIEIRRKAAAAGGGGAGAPLSARLLNNAAVLHLRAGESAAAHKLMAAAMTAATGAGGGGEDLNPLSQVTLGYNLARVKEACGDLQAAEREYRELLAQFPRYGDCCLRLACIAKARGDTKDVLAWTEAGAAIPAYRGDALALQAAMYLEKRDYAHAKQVLDRLHESEDGRQESFSRLAMANLYAYSAPSLRKHKADKQRAEHHLSHAMELYRRVLEKDEGCISAANGVGCVLAKAGHLRAAKDVFLQVQEASAASAGFWRMPDAWVNLANVYLAQEQYGPAIQMYRNALRKFFDNRSAVVMLYLARAQYDADQLQDAKRTLTKALHLAPADNNLRFNVALTLQEWAVRTLSRKEPSDPSAFADYSRALRELEHAHRFFQHLHGLGKASELDVRKLKHHVNFIAETHQNSRARLEAAREAAEGAARQQAEAQAVLRADQMERQLAEQRAAAEEQASKRMREEQAEMQAEKLRALQQQWRTSAAVQKAVEKGDSGVAAKAAEAAAKAAAAAQEDALFASESDDEEYNPEAFDEEFPDAAPPGAAGGGGGAAGGAQGPAGGYEDLEDELFDEEEDEEAVVAAGGGGGGGLEDDETGGGSGAPPPAKRAKHQAVLDSDEEDE